MDLLPPCAAAAHPSPAASTDRKPAPAPSPSSVLAAALPKSYTSSPLRAPLRAPPPPPCAGASLDLMSELLRLPRRGRRLAQQRPAPLPRAGGLPPPQPWARHVPSAAPPQMLAMLL